MLPEISKPIRPRPAYDSGLHYARVGLIPNWGALWISGRYDEFLRGYDAGLGETPVAADPGLITRGTRTGE